MAEVSVTPSYAHCIHYCVHHCAFPHALLIDLPAAPMAARQLLSQNEAEVTTPPLPSYPCRTVFPNSSRCVCVKQHSHPLLWFCAPSPLVTRWVLHATHTPPPRPLRSFLSITVDPRAPRNVGDGSTRTPFASFPEAWASLPRGRLTRGVLINIVYGV